MRDKSCLDREGPTWRKGEEEGDAYVRLNVSSSL